MILKNYWKWLSMSQSYLAIKNATGDEQIGGFIATNGNSISNLNASYANNWAADVYYQYSAKNRFLGDITAVLGTGENTYTSDSYNLANTINGIDNLQVNLSFSVDNGLHRVITITGRYLSANPTTITDVGIIKPIYKGSYNEPSSDNIMLAIIQLDNPLSVAYGDNFSITIDWTEN